MPLKSRLCALILIAAVAALTVSPAHAGFFGPDNEPLTPAQISERLQREPITFSGGGKALEIRTKGAAIGGFIAGFILSSAMASGGSVPGNPAQMQQQMQARMDIAQQFNANFQVAANRLSAEAAGAAAGEIARRGPLPLLLQTLSGDLRERQVRLADANPAASAATSVDASADASAPAKPVLALTLSQTEWKLEFEAFSSDYALKTALTLELIDKAADKLHLRAICQQDYPKKMELDDWERDDHLAIAQAADDIARRCHGEFMAALTPTADVANPPASAALPTVSTEAAGQAQDIAAVSGGSPNQPTQPTQPANTEQ